MKITGKLLKEHREKKGISIGEVALATKINNRTIIALEEGDVESLPPKTFLRGFVRSYASFLELDVDQVLNTFYEEMGTTKPKSSAPDGTSNLTPPNGPAPKTRNSTPEADQAINPTTSLTVKIGAVAGILLLVVLIVFFKNKMESYEKESQKGEVPPLEALASPTPSATPAGSPDPLASPGASPSASASPSGTPTGAAPGSGATPLTTPAATAMPAATPIKNLAPAIALPKVTPTPSATPKPTPKPTATPQPSPAPTATPKPSPKPTPKPTATPNEKPEQNEATASAAAEEAAKPTPKPAKAQEVIIEALDSVDVDLQVDGEPSKRIHLKTDQVQSVKAKRKVIMKFSDGGAVNVIVNGTDRGVPGDLGKPHRLEIP